MSMTNEELERELKALTAFVSDAHRVGNKDLGKLEREMDGVWKELKELKELKERLSSFITNVSSVMYERMERLENRIDKLDGAKETRP